MLNGRPRNGSGAKDSPWPTGCAWPSATDWTPTYGRPTKPGELATGGYGRSADPWSLERSEVTARGSGRHLIGRGLALLALLALLGVPNFDVDLEFSGSVSEACFIDVAAHVPVDSGQSVAELGRCWRGVGGEQRA